MGEGWETARRGGGNDWVIVALAGARRLCDVVFDTGHFIGYAPGEVQVSGARIERTGPDATNLAHRTWTPLIKRRPAQPDTPRRFRIGPGAPTVTHLRVDIYPDGGFARLRPTASSPRQPTRRPSDGGWTPCPRRTCAKTLTDAGLDRAPVAGALSVRARRVEWSSELLAAFAPP